MASRPKAPKPPTLTLTDDSHLVGTARMAELAGVSDQTLYDWESEGKLVALGIVFRENGQRRWDHKALLAWRDRHKPVGGQIHGGKREGAGRKTAQAQPVSGVSGKSGRRAGTERRESPGAVSQETAPGDSERTTQLTPRPGAMSPTLAPGRTLNNVTLSDMADDGEDMELFKAADREIAAAMEGELGDVAGTLTVARSGKITAAEALTAVKLQEAKRKMIDNRERLGQLVDAEQVVATMTRALQKVREPFDTFPDRLGSELMARMGLTPSQAGIARQIALSEVHRVYAALIEALRNPKPENGDTRVTA